MTDFLRLSNCYTEEERLIYDATTRFVSAHVLPVIAEAYEAGTFPKTLIKQMADLGLFGMTLPTQYGGSAASYTAYGLACQALEYGDSGLRSFVSVQSSLCMYPIFAFGTDAQKDRYLKKMAAGEMLGCFGLTEPDVGSDPANMKTTAKPTKGGYILNGAKMWITNATIADIAIVWAKLPSNEVRGFIVEKGMKGFSTQEIHHKMSLRASITGELIFDDCFIPEENLLPGTEKGLSAALSCLSKARYGIAWGAIGAAMACYEAALTYTQTRKQFDKPIAQFQLVQHALVDMLTEITKSQAFNYRLGQLHDRGEVDFAMISMAKMNACQVGLKVAREARNLLGANGISLEYPVIRHMMNLESVFTYEGTDNMHHLIVGRQVTGLSAFA